MGINRDENHKIKVSLFGFFFLFFLSVQGLAQSPNAEHLDSFDLVWRTVNNTHFDPSFNGVDWKARYNWYRPQIVSSQGVEEFIRLSNQMLFEIGASHLLVASEDMLKTYMPTLFASGDIGVEIRWLNNMAVIVKAKPGFPGWKAGLKPGYSIIRIDGRDVNDIVRHLEVLPPYNDRNRKGNISNYLEGCLDGFPGTSVSIEYLDENSQLKETVSVRQTRGVGKIIDNAMPPLFVEFEARRLKNDIGYIRFNHFAAPVEKKFQNALETMRDRQGLVFDLRGNPGGYFRIMDAIIEHLITVKTPLYRFRFRERTVEKILNPSKKPYKKPVAVLIDVTSTSCSEHFAACLQSVGRAVVVGERSPGYLLGADWIRLPNGLSFMHTILQPIPWDGRIVEGAGVKPDIEIDIDIDGLLGGKDDQLEAAITYIAKLGTS